jgi:hypothetical protein
MTGERLVVRRAEHVDIRPREADERNRLTRSVLVHNAHSRTIPTFWCVLKIVGKVNCVLGGEDYRTGGTN